MAVDIKKQADNESTIDDKKESDSVRSSADRVKDSTRFVLH